MRLQPILRAWLTLIAAAMLMATPSSAHVVEQLFAEVKGGTDDWEVEVLFDAGYAKPEWRGDPDSPQPDRAWLIHLEEADHEALRRETAAYLDECLSFASAGEIIEVDYRFIDFDNTPPDFPKILNGGAYLRVRITPKTKDPAAGVDCGLNHGERPKFVFKRTTAGEATYLTLKPGESFLLFPPSEKMETPPDSPYPEGDSVYLYSLKQGFLHVIPDGLDHVLFILALFLLQRDWRTLLWQSLAFTAAHTLTLGLTASGILAPKAGGVEAMIALSIAILAMENLFKKECSPWRILMVFGFGLIHGMGFANALSSLLTPGDGFLRRLVVTNLGVEIAQVTILGLAWLLTTKWHDTSHYRTFRIAGNIGIALVASVWLIQRFAFIV